MEVELRITKELIQASDEEKAGLQQQIVRLESQLVGDSSPERIAKEVQPATPIVPPIAKKGQVIRAEEVPAMAEWLPPIQRI